MSEEWTPPEGSGWMLDRHVEHIERTTRRILHQCPDISPGELVSLVGDVLMEIGSLKGSIGLWKEGKR